MKGYSIALSTSVTIGLMMRKLLGPMTKNAVGNRLLLLNTIVGATASGSASFCNSISMRYKEIDQGISIYKDEMLTDELGNSKLCAKRAVYYTASSRIVLSSLGVSAPTVIILFFRALRVNPTNRHLSSLWNWLCIGFGQLVAVSLGLALFPRKLKINGA
jgi:hypothetical protein